MGSGGITPLKTVIGFWVFISKFDDESRKHCQTSDVLNLGKNSTFTSEA